jgi:hypothetical protein
MMPLLLLVLLAAGHGAAHAQDRRLSRVPAPIATDGGARELYTGSYALLVGVSRYDASSAWATLDSIPREMNELADALRAAGFDKVEQMSNPTGIEMRRGVEDFIGRYVEGHRILIFFSGHGYTLDKGARGYFVPRDAPDPLTSETAFRRVAVSMDQVATWARDLVARHALFSFDSCFSGTIFRTRDRAIPQRISEMTAKPVREFMSAGGPGEPVPARSVFTPVFIRGLKGAADLDQDGFVTGTELGNYVQREVIAYKTRQTPQFGKIRDPELDEGDFVFAIAPALAPAPAPRPAPAPPPVITSHRGITTLVPTHNSPPELTANAIALANSAAKGGGPVRGLNATTARRDFFKAGEQQTYVVYSVLVEPGAQPPPGYVVYVRAAPADSAGGASKLAWDNIAYFPAAKGTARAELRAALGLKPGAYNLHVVVTAADQSQPRWASIVERLDVPHFGSELTTSSVILGDRLNVLSAPVAASDVQLHPYAFGATEVGVSPERIFRRSDELNVAFVIYNNQLRPSGKPDVRVDFEFYLITGSDKKFFNRTAPTLHNSETLPAAFDSAHHVLLSGVAVPLSSFAPGEYRLDINIHDLAGVRRIIRTVFFTVVPS